MERAHLGCLLILVPLLIVACLSVAAAMTGAGLWAEASSLTCKGTTCMTTKLDKLPLEEWNRVGPPRLRARFFIFLVEIIYIAATLFLLFYRAFVSRSRFVELGITVSGLVIFILCGALEAWYSSGIAMPDYRAKSWGIASGFLLLSAILFAIDSFYVWKYCSQVPESADVASSI